MGYDFDIVYKPGVENKIVDALSRVPSAVEFAAVSLVGGLNTSLIHDQQVHDVKLNAIRRKIILGDDVPVAYTLKGFLLLLEFLVYIIV